MLFIYILLGICLLFAIVLCIPIRLQIDYNEEVTVLVRYLFFRFQVLPPKEEKTHKKKKYKKLKKEELEKKNSLQELLKEKGIGGFLSFLGRMAQIAIGAGRRLFSHIVLRKYELELSVAGSDAADTALRFGKMNAAVYNASSVLLHTMKHKDKKVSICVFPNFFSEDSGVEFHGVVSVQGVWLLTAAMRAVVQFLKYQFQQQKRVRCGAEKR